MTRQIACGHCGQSHATVAEVRACSRTGSAPGSAIGDGGGGGGEGTSVADRPRPDQEGSTATVPVEARGPELLAGPDRLGRSLLIAPGADVPAPWEGAPVVAASLDCDQATVERLHAAWRERRRLVIEWRGPLPDRAPVLAVPFHALTPASELPGERLRFAATANAVNLLGPKPAFEPISLAVAAGAAPLPGPGDGRPGDVIARDGGPAWADGGPLDVFSAAEVDRVGVIPRPHLVSGLAAIQRHDPPAPTAELAPDQLAAVGHRGGPARIIAPAGSGKTRVLTERTRHLVHDRGLQPAAVSLVAYNRRARREMAERLDDVAGLDIRTLNSLALAIATGSGPFSGGRSGRPAVTISEIDARRLLDRVVPGRRRRQLTDPLEPWIDALSACRLGLRDPEEVESTYGGDIAGFGDVLDRYRDELARRGELDFDEQILGAIDVLASDPAARAAARRAAPILLVDEFQDLTPAHLVLLRLLAGPAAEVFAVGDDDQTIYGYSGASPDWLVGFSRFFPGAEDHPLTVNYRCPPPLVTAASNLLTHNRNRVPKTIVAGGEDAGGDEAGPTASPGGSLVVNAETDCQQRAVDHIEGLLAAGARPSDVAVLARVNAALLPPAVYLADAGIPVDRPIGVDERMLDRSGVAAALSWLRLATGPAQGLRADDLRLALRRPPRSLHPRVADWVCEQRSVERLRALSDRLNREREAQLVAELAADIEGLRTRAGAGADTVELLDFVFADIGLLGAATQLDQSQRTARRAAHADDLAALRAVAAIGPDPADFEAWLRQHLRELPAGEDPAPGGADRVTLATIHSTKGLEWPHVIVHDVRGDLHPHRLATDIEEERRIFHVAITRGRRSVLVNAGPRRPGSPPSPFVAEMERARAPDEAWPEEPAGRGAAEARTAGQGRPRAGVRGERAEPADANESARRQALTEWRARRSRADGVPAYIVLDNATLDAIAAAAPASLVALGRIKGIGPVKLDRYGADILGVVAGADGR